VTCGALEREDTYRVCAVYKQAGGFLGTCDTSSATTVSSTPDLKFIYDTRAPSAPGIEEVVPLDSALSVHVEASGDASQVRVTVVRTATASDPDAGTDGGTESDAGTEADGGTVSAPTTVAEVTQSVDQPRFRVEGLENGVTYLITAKSIDAAGNESAASEAKQGTPVKTLGFYDAYIKAGGRESGGCDATGGGIAGGAMLAVLAFWLSSRRSRS
jgi:uncharacterized protein (TIGR03382 family)